MKFLVLLSFIILDCVHSQIEDNITLNNTYLAGIFDIPTEEPCKCVKKSLCFNGTETVINISEEDSCNSYLLKCCKKEHIISEPPPAPIKPRGCGNRNEEGVGARIAGKVIKETQYAEYPWMVAILTEEPIDTTDTKLLVYKCGGSLIHPEVVLTAAHCVNKEETEFMIRAGEWDTQSKLELYPHQDREVKSIIIHPDFKQRSLHNDVALIILNSPFTLMKTIETVCLPSQDEILLNSKCTATGWGKKSFDKDSRYQEILKKVDLPIVQHDLCQEQLRTSRVGEYFILDKSFICAGGEVGIDVCTGDGGSPLVCPIPGKRGKYYQRGIVSWGIGCGNALPGVYGNVADFRNWIDNEMFKLNFNTSTYTL